MVVERCDKGVWGGIRGVKLRVCSGVVVHNINIGLRVYVLGSFSG